MEITVKVTDVTNKMFLHQFVGEGSYGDTEIELCVILPTMSPYIKVKDKRFAVDINDIVKAIMEEIENEA